MDVTMKSAATARRVLSSLCRRHKPRRYLDIL